MFQHPHRFLQTLRASALIGLISLLAACGGGSSSDSATTVTTQGTVVDDQGIPLPGATIKVIAASAGTESTSTANDGSFSIALSKTTAGVIRVEKTGFMPMVRAAGDAASNAAFAARVVLLPVASTQTFDSTQAAVLRVPGSAARVELAAGSLVRSDGQAISGSATVQLTPIDPSKDISHMPGVMVDANSGTPIESLGALSVNFTDATGAPLNLASGQTATIRIPATPAPGASVASLPATFPLYHLNETTGLWVQEGTATLQTDPVTGDKYYEGTVSHFSTWNADVSIVSATIRMVDSGGSICPIPNDFHLRVLGLDYNGELLTRTKDGQLTVKAGALVRVFLMNPYMEIVDSVDMTAPAVGEAASIPRCLTVQPKVKVSGKVTVINGSLSNYRVVVAGERLVKRRVPIAEDGSYSVDAFVNSGYIRAELISATFRGTPDTQVTTTVATENASFPDLVVQDTRFDLTGCVQGWGTYRQTSAQVSVFLGAKQIGQPQTLQSNRPNFTFTDLPLNSTLTFRVTAPDSTLAEKTTQLVVGSAPATLGACLELPKAPTAQMLVNGTGFDRNFNASTSVAGDAAITSYAWNFGDGNTGTGATVSHTYASVGSYNATLTISDALGQKSLPLTVPVVVTNGSTVSSTGDQIAQGTTGGCAINSNGGVECWDDSTNSKTALPDLASGVTAIAAGASHYCAIATGGSLKCWGSNTFGQLGNGTTNTANSPVSVSDMSSGVQAVSAGPYHTCAITSAGGVKCWGQGSFLGRNSSTDSSVPVDVSGLTNGVIAIAAGGGASTGHTCAVASGAGVLCWGNGTSGQLGQGSTDSSLTPVPVSELTGSVIALSAGENHSCALTAAGGVKCWGGNGSGQLGDTTTTQRTTPVNVVGLNGIVTAITGHFSHTCALIDGNSRCWGNNAYGQTDAQPLADLSVMSISTGKYSTCRMLSNRVINCWGWTEAYEPGG